MKNQLIIGAIFCFVLLCMMPMISAVELKTVEKTQGSKMNTESERIFINKIGDVIKKGSLPKHLTLFIIVVIQVYFRFFRYAILQSKSIGHPLLYLRSLWLLITVIIESYFWGKISDLFGWNWQYLLGLYWPWYPSHQILTKNL
jgi:hypothetical protein